MLHVAGTILGTGGATVAEIQIHKALRDGQVTSDEGQLLHANYFLIRVGIAILILSGFAMLWYFWVQDTLFRLLSDWVIFKQVLLLTVVINAVAISNRWLPLWLGAAISFTSWWSATLLGVAGPVPYPFWLLALVFVVLVFGVAVLQHQITRIMQEH